MRLAIEPQLSNPLTMRLRLNPRCLSSEPDQFLEIRQTARHNKEPARIDFLLVDSDETIFLVALLQMEHKFSFLRVAAYLRGVFDDVGKVGRVVAFWIADGEA